MLKNKILITIIPITILFSFSGISNANAKTVNMVHTKKFTKNFAQYKKLAERLSKQGYVYSINKGSSFGTNTYPVVQYSHKDTQLVINKKVRFKVQHIWSYKNGTSVNLVSKDKKYNAWVNFPSSLYNIHSKYNDLKPLVSFAKKIFYKKVKNNKYNLNKLRKMANNIKSTKERKLANHFVSQFDHFLLKDRSFNSLPDLLIGNLY
ncbi:hypothetical protein DY138_01475 [Apilactobacillus timberlakei]|uniref:hypothetical protein n=1 Tax=Apilactobacillus timberlakei TaxID=2008380 RepID=UPI00112BED3A|nr:hypothetical protein [Apilactobacillus timberlakei]TPR20137.1 hypothetical protein DY138_01475 [Apilactobacillus timberlakei]TPR20450.1 hypothetical protein DY083_08300 [Apilactobacillus timberlakei]TPR21855.1 hypothetical protein DY061_01390 [Apilactobacillus timberlakei]